MTDQLTPDQRLGAVDCLVELARAWLQRPLVSLSEAERALAIQEVCLWIAQMRHRDAHVMAVERNGWIDRVTNRLVRECPGLRGHETAVQFELEKRIMLARCDYHNWRDDHAPIVRRRDTSHVKPETEGTSE